MRLFLAIAIPDAWRREAARALDELTAALDDGARPLLRPVAADRLHLTLRFLGEVDSALLAPLQRALAEAVPRVAVDLELAPAGSFGPAARTSVAWLGVGGDLAALRDLAARVERAVVAAGLPRDPRAPREPRPHLTLARVRPRAAAAQRRAIAHAVAALAPPPPLPHRSEQLVLIHSRLTGDGPSYEALQRL